MKSRLWVALNSMSHGACSEVMVSESELSIAMKSELWVL
jgi:hypothetical protein